MPGWKRSNFHSPKVKLPSRQVRQQRRRDKEKKKGKLKMILRWHAAALLVLAASWPVVRSHGMKGFNWRAVEAAASTASTERSLPRDSPVPRGGAAAAVERKKRPVYKGSASPSKTKGGLVVKKKMKKMKRKISMQSIPQANGGTSGPRGDTMPSIFRIPSEEKYDRYSAALAVTEGLRRVRDREITRAEEAKRRKKRNQLSTDWETAKKRAESAYLLQSTKAVKALGMTAAQFNQIGREVISDPALKDRVSEQAYLYRVASTVNLDKVPLLDDPSSKKLLQSAEHKKHRVQLFARSIHEIEDLRSDQMEALKQSLQVERFPPGFDISDPNVQPLLHPEVRAVCEKFPVQAEEIVKRYGLGSDEFNRMLEETKGNPIFRWRVHKYVQKAEEDSKRADNV